MLDQLDKRIIAVMQDEFPVSERPYRDIASKVGIDEETLITRLKHYREKGFIRKMGAVLRHREVGFVANALCAWIVPQARLAEAGAAMAASAAVTHCYAREPQQDWPYNLYIMLHARTREECRAQAARLGEAAGLTDYIMLFSTKEWKKSNVRYFGRSEK